MCKKQHEYNGKQALQSLLPEMNNILSSIRAANHSWTEPSLQVGMNYMAVLPRTSSTKETRNCHFFLTLFGKRYSKLVFLLSVLQRMESTCSLRLLVIAKNSFLRVLFSFLFFLESANRILIKF